MRGGNTGVCTVKEHLRNEKTLSYLDGASFSTLHGTGIG